MIRLLAVRHGQASAGSDDYDQLSEKGFEQSRRLGTWLANSGIRPRRVLVGAMRRHRQTLDALAETYAATLPEAETLSAFNEFDHGAVLAGFCRVHAEHPAAAMGARPWQAPPRQIAALIHAALSAWSTGSLDDEPEVEAWSDFRQRVYNATDAIHDGQGGDILLVSSGGVLTQLLMKALDVPDARAAELNLGIRNSALCEFLVEPESLRMLGWNGLPHLADKHELWTHY